MTSNEDLQKGDLKHIMKNVIHGKSLIVHYTLHITES